MTKQKKANTQILVDAVDLYNLLIAVNKSPSDSISILELMATRNPLITRNPITRLISQYESQRDPTNNTYLKTLALNQVLQQELNDADDFYYNYPQHIKKAYIEGAQDLLIDDLFNRGAFNIQLSDILSLWERSITYEAIKQLPLPKKQGKDNETS